MADKLTTRQRSEQMRRVRSGDTKPEMVVRRTAFALGYRFRLHVNTLPGSPDLVFPRLRKVVFVHGCFWHQHSCKRGNRQPKSNVEYWKTKLDRNKRRDRGTRVRLRKLGWRVLVVWECQTVPSKQGRMAERLQQFLTAT